METVQGSIMEIVTTNGGQRATETIHCARCPRPAPLPTDPAFRSWVVVLDPGGWPVLACPDCLTPDD